jgi:hypothetical protein
MAERKEEWLPIESAPRGPWILLVGGEYAREHFIPAERMPPMFVGRSLDGFAEAAEESSKDGADEFGYFEAWQVGTYDVCATLELIKPTHWMPLPPPAIVDTHPKGGNPEEGFRS